MKDKNGELKTEILQTLIWIYKLDKKDTLKYIRKYRCGAYYNSK